MSCRAPAVVTKQDEWVGIVLSRFISSSLNQPPCFACVQDPGLFRRAVCVNLGGLQHVGYVLLQHNTAHTCLRADLQP